MAYHHIGHFGDGGILRQHTADVLAVSEYSHSIGQRFDFMHFMGNDDDSLAVISHFRRTLNSFSVSCGVSTAVGSSRIRISAPRYSTFTISTVCFWDTDIS